MLDKETKSRLKADYMNGILSEPMICAKYAIGPDILIQLIQIGDGEEVFPLPWRGAKKQTTADPQDMRTVAELSQTKLTPDEQFLSAHDQNAMLTFEEREAAEVLSAQELEFCNLQLRGVRTTPAAMQAFDLDSIREAMVKATKLKRDAYCIRYLGIMKRKKVLGVVRDRGWAEAVLHRIIDRSMELDQVYLKNGTAVKGMCHFDAKGATAALVVLMRLKGWDKETSDWTEEPQHARIKRISEQGRVIEGELTSDH